MTIHKDMPSSINEASSTEGDKVFLETTRSICPVCRSDIDAGLYIASHRVYLGKRCPTHGYFEALVWSDADMYLEALRYNKPGMKPLEFGSQVKEGCPHDCGICPEHQQHTCLGIIEITGRCNLRCPTCFAGEEHGAMLSLKQVEDILDNFLRREAQPEVVQISGGEPTVHPDIIPILRLAKSRSIKYVMLNTNGLRIARDQEFVAQLADVRPVVYLQFDALSEQPYRVLRGVNGLLGDKLQALDHLAQAEIDVVLVATIVKGVNDHEIGAITELGVEHPAVRGVCFQPAAYVGRHLPFLPLERTTLPDVIRAVEEQTQGIFLTEDFIPVPCPYPTCSATTYAYIKGEKVTPLPRILNVDDYLGYFTNRAVPDLSPEVKTALEGLWSASAVAGSDRMAVNCSICGVDAAIDVSSLEKNVFMVTVHGLMDAYTFDLKRAKKCCVHELLPDGRMIPFCVYNNIGYRERTARLAEDRL
ncbi:MAG: radical SAM protein [Dehalococcoidia bacterium]